MMLTAGVVSVLFKKLRLPLILGYIVAGFLISPYFPLFFDVESRSAIETLSEVGVIIILFHIGLEFNLHKLFSIGSTAIVTAFIKMSGVMVAGYGFGMLIGMSRMNCMFLGAMLSISSTAVIKKCFEEAGVQNEKYASLVMGTLIMEDIFSVLIMVVLSTLSVQSSIDGQDLILNLAMMGAYLIVWLILGIYLLPTILNRTVPLMSQEMMIAFSLGVCFGMALLAKWLGFSVELGAFMAGSLFAGTVHVEKIEHATDGIKDMFSVIFFLSVGMLVDPQVVVERWTTIVPIAILAVVAKLVFATLGMILSGQTFGTAIRSGFSLAPIGEFSFIIASLGISIGVMESYLYPVIVSASVLTILVTPTLIRNSGSIIDFLGDHLPVSWIEKMRQYSSEQDSQDEEEARDWAIYLKEYISNILIYGVIMLVAAIIGVRLLAPALDGIMAPLYAKIATSVVILLVLAIFLRPLLNLHNTTFTHLWLDRRANRPPLVVFTLSKVILVGLIIFYVFHRLFDAHEFILLFFAIVSIYVVGRTDIVSTSYLQLETQFLRNLNERTIARESKDGAVKEWLDEDINIISFFAEEGANYLDKQLMELNWGKNYDIYVVKLRRGEKSILLPSGTESLHAGDKIYVVGELAAIRNFFRIIDIEPYKKIRTLREFMETGYPDTENALSCLAVKVQGQEPYSGKPIKESRFLERGRCMILGLQREGYSIMMPDANMLIQKGDIIWIMGSNNTVGRVAALSTAGQ